MSQLKNNVRNHNPRPHIFSLSCRKLKKDLLWFCVFVMVLVMLFRDKDYKNILAMSVTGDVAAVATTRQQRAFVCITGQRQRLELRNKINRILNPLRDFGFDVHVALLISDETKVHFTNKERISPAAFETYQDAHKYLSNHNFTVVTDQPTIQSETPIMNEQYLVQLNKHYMTQAEQANRASNHIRQFQVLTKCGEAMMEASSLTSSASSQQQQEEDRFFYDLILRARDDVGLLEPLKVEQITQLLFRGGSEQQQNGDNKNEPTILSSDCRAFEGMNDRFAIVTPDAAFHYFMDPLINMYTQSIHNRTNNPETYLLYTYLDAGMTVLQTPHLRGVVKLDYQSKLADDKGGPRCPKGNGNKLRSSKYTTKRGNETHYKKIVLK